MASVAIVVGVAGRVFAAPELYLFAALLLALVIGCTVHVAITRPDLELSRTLHPRRVHAGIPARVDISVVNRARRRSPIVEITDPVTGTRGARILVDPLRPGETRRCAYRLPTARRGVVVIGPATTTVMDPFGLVAKRRVSSEMTELTVYPRLDTVLAPPGTTGRDPLAGIEHPSAIQGTGEDFYALRDYVVGDDLRHIHWPSTARNDELTVRQDELPWQGRSTVFIDTRAPRMTPELFESALSAAASIIDASVRRGDLVRLVLADGSDSGIASGFAQLPALFEMLATARDAPPHDTGDLVRSLTRSHATGGLTIIGVGWSTAELDLLGELRRKFSPVTVVNLTDTRSEGSDALGAMPVRPGFVIITTTHDGFVEAWNETMRTDRGRPDARRRPTSPYRPRTT